MLSGYSCLGMLSNLITAFAVAATLLAIGSFVLVINPVSLLLLGSFTFLQTLFSMSMLSQFKDHTGPGQIRVLEGREEVLNSVSAHHLTGQAASNAEAGCFVQQQDNAMQQAPVDECKNEQGERSAALEGSMVCEQGTGMPGPARLLRVLS